VVAYITKIVRIASTTNAFRALMVLVKAAVASPWRLQQLHVTLAVMLNMLMCPCVLITQEKAHLTCAFLYLLLPRSSFRGMSGGCWSESLLLLPAAVCASHAASPKNSRTSTCVIYTNSQRLLWLA
jgi:hypothetical protein